MLKRILHRIVVRAERFADRYLNRTADGREIDPYIGYATPTQFILRGRVLTKLRSDAPVRSQSRLANLRDMLALFMTDEVANTTVRCADVTALTDEEGYFTIALPRDERSDWHEEDVYVEGRSEPVACPFFIPGADAQFLVISDIDDTMMETGAYSLIRNLYTSFTGNSQTRHIFPDAVNLMNELSNKGLNPVFYVSSSPWNMHAFLGAIFARANLVRGPMFLRDLGFSDTKFITDGHGNHKGGSIDHILNANPDLPAILLGDTGQHDARIYHAATNRHPGRIIAVGLRTPGPGVDAEDKADLAALQDSGVPTYAAPDFTEMGKMLRSSLPEYFAKTF